MKFVPRKKYGFEKMKKGDTKHVKITATGREGIQALTAAYAFARRHNEKLPAKSKKRIAFSGRRNVAGTVMVIHRTE